MSRVLRGVTTGVVGLTLALTAACGEETQPQPRGASGQPPATASAPPGGDSSGPRAVGGAQAGFRMILTESFEPVKVGEAGRKAIKKHIKELAGNNPYAQQLTKNLFTEKIRLFAFAPPSLKSSPNGFATNLNVARLRAPRSVSIGQARRAAKSAVDLFGKHGLKPTDVQLSTVRLAESKAAKVSYRRLTPQGFRVTQVQYYVPGSPKFVYVLTFTTDQPKRYGDAFTRMGQSFRLT